MAQRNRSRARARELSASERQNRQRDEWREQRHVQPHRAFADRAHSQNIPRRADRDHRKSEDQPAMPRDEPRHELADVVDAQIGVQRHFKHAARQRQPRFLKSPEPAHPSPHPDVEAALFGDRGRQFAHHHGGGQAPQQRRDHQDQQRRGVAGLLDDVLEAIGSARDHEVGCRDHGHDGNFRDAFQAAVRWSLHLRCSGAGYSSTGFSLWRFVVRKPDPWKPTD